MRVRPAGGASAHALGAGALAAVTAVAACACFAAQHGIMSLL